MTKKSQVAMVLLLCLALSGCGKGARAPMSGKTLTDAQRFTLEDLKGEEVVLDTLLAKNKAVLINFWATWCDYCKEEIPDLVRLQMQYKGQGFTVLGINVGETKSEAKKFSEKAGVNFPILLDREVEVSQAYGVVGIPTSVLVNADGKVIGEYHSFTQKLEDDVEKLVTTEHPHV